VPLTLKPERLPHIVAAAGQVFARVGYRRAMMSDLAAEAGVALGTLYSYAESKEELFERSLRLGFGAPVDSPAAPGLGFEESVFGFVRDRLAEAGRFPALSAAADQPPAGDLAAELETVVGEVYDAIAALHLGIRILDRSAGDWPELAELFVTEVRRPALDRLERYLASRVAAGVLPAPPSIAVAARLVVETCAVLAMHRRFTSGGSYADDGLARRSALVFVVAGLSGGRPAAQGEEPAR
jgi:AcrR family transcriptional regulator